MMRKMLLSVIVLVLLATTLYAYQERHPDSPSSVMASLEIGADSLQRRYFRPKLRFDFPLNWGNIFMEMNYYQRINSRLIGEVDFWLLGGVMIDVSASSQLEVSLNHMSRHVTSEVNPVIFDVNELLARFWIRDRRISLGLGGGGYLGGNDAYDNLLAFNIALPQILGTEFGISAEAKWVNFTKILSDFEFYITLSKSVDLFVRNSRHYDYDATTYIGMRLRAGRNDKHFLKKLKLRSGTLPADNRYKLETKTEFYLEFLRTSKAGLQLMMNSRIPILENEEILGPFRPEKIAYPMVLEYERKISDDLLILGTINYNAEMPLDTDKAFTSTLGLGVGISNQSFFEKLDKRFRYAISGGRNFKHDYNAEARFGVNTLNSPLNFATDARLLVNDEAFYGSLEIFAEFGGEIKARLFLNGDYTDSFRGTASRATWRFGFEFIRWF
ncbi:MAG: hypothetical protein JXB23_15600 [Candidatus Aminicenantes bacterium]|nr:hypothetical protein [Candidatus Aminicenantes bacterium]